MIFPTLVCFKQPKTAAPLSSRLQHLGRTDETPAREEPRKRTEEEKEGVVGAASLGKDKPASVFPRNPFVELLLESGLRRLPQKPLPVFPPVPLVLQISSDSSRYGSDGAFPSTHRIGQQVMPDRIDPSLPSTRRTLTIPNTAKLTRDPQRFHLYESQTCCSILSTSK